MINIQGHNIESIIPLHTCFTTRPPKLWQMKMIGLVLGTPWSKLDERCGAGQCEEAPVFARWSSRADRLHAGVCQLPKHPRPHWNCMRKALFEPLKHTPRGAHLAIAYHPHGSKFSQHVRHGSEDLVRAPK